MSEKEQNDQLAVPEPESTAPEASDGDSEQSKNRRHFLTAGLGALAAGAAVTAAAVTSPRRPTTTKSKILARIQEELDKEYLNDPLTYHTTAYHEYTKAS